jgi:hypothetical protein
MGYDWAHRGSVRLKPSSTLQDVLNLYPCGDAEPHLPLTPDGEIELEDGHVSIEVSGDMLVYSADGDSIALDDMVTTFLTEVAEELAAEGWIDYELEDFEVPYGPTELLRARARLQSAKGALESAQRAVASAEADVRRLEDTHA